MQMLVERYKKRGKIVLVPESQGDADKINMVKKLSKDTTSPEKELHIEFSITQEEDDKDAIYVNLT